MEALLWKKQRLTVSLYVTTVPLLVSSPPLPHTHTQSGLSYQKLMKRQPLFNLPSPKCTFRFFTLTNILCHTPCLKMFSNSTLPPVSLQKSKWWGVGGGSLKSKKRFPLSTLSISRQTPVLSGALNDGFLLNTLKTLFRLSRALLDIYKCILRGARKFVSVRSSQGNLSLFEITRA